MDNIEQTINRVRLMFYYEASLSEVRDELKKEGMSDADIFLVVKAAEVMGWKKKKD